MDNTAFQTDPAAVVSEVIEGEAIIMDLRNGAYYSADGLGAQIWQAMLDGASRGQILAWIGSAYPASEGASAETEAFIGEVLAHGLMKPTGIASSPVLPDPLPAYRTPQLAAHADMQDLIMLDPIHEVGEVGWPAPKPPSA